MSTPEIPTSNTAEFLQAIENQDHIEANMIHAEYQALIANGVEHEVALPSAIETIDADMALTVNGGKEFGYQKAVNASRWQKFIEMYLKDIEPIYRELDKTDAPASHGLEQEFMTYGEKLEVLESMSFISAQELIKQNPHYIETLAMAQKNQMIRRTAEEFRDPFEVQFEYSLRHLTAAIDGIAASDEQYIIFERKDALDPQVKWKISRFKWANFTDYIICQIVDFDDDTKPVTLVSKITRKNGQVYDGHEEGLEEYDCVPLTTNTAINAAMGLAPR